MSSTMTLERLQVVMEANTKKFNEEIKKVQNQVKAMADSVNKQVSKVKSSINSITKSVVGLFALSKVGQYIKNSLQSAMQVEASLQQIARTMGESTQSFLKWAKTNALSFNMAQSDALKFGATYSNLVSSFLTDTNQITGATTELLKASSIIASATGRTMDDVMERIRSGLLGNTEAIEDLGVNVNVALLETTEAFKRLANGKSWNQLSFQTQQQIRLMAILEQTSSKFGNEVFQNTNSSLQQLVAILKDVALNLGNAFLPIANVVIPLLSKMAMWLRTVTGYFAAFMQALFGVKSTIKDAAKSTISLGDSSTALGDSIEAAGTKAKRSVAGFDEVNQLQQTDASSGSGGTGTAAGGIDLGNIGSFEFEEPDTSKIEAWVTKFKDLFKPLTESWEKVKKALQPIIETVGSALKWLYDNVLVPFTTWSISDLLPAFFDLLAGALEVLYPILKSFQPSFQWLWDNVLKPIASWTGGVVVQVLEGLGGALAVIGDWMSDNQSIVDSITTSIVGFFLAWKVTELLAFIQTSGGVIGVLSAIKNAIVGCTVAKLADKVETITLTAMYAKDFVVSLATSTAALVKQATQWTINTSLKIANTAAQVAMTAATATWNVICGLATIATTAFGAAVAFLTSPIGLAIVAIGAIIAVAILLWQNWDEISAWLIEIWEKIKNKAIDIWTRIKTWFSDTWDAIKTNVIQVWSSIKTWLSDTWDSINVLGETLWATLVAVCTEYLEGLKTYISEVWEGIKLIFSGIIDFITGVFTGDWERAWEGVKKVFKGIFETFESIVKTPINAIIGMINKVIDGMNSLSISFPDWIPGVGGKTFGVNIPKIPKLARGGIVDGATNFGNYIAGEAGKEMIVPLENTPFVNKLASALGTAVMQAMMLNNANRCNGGNYEFVFNLGNKTLVRYLMTEFDKEKTRIGKSVINIG